VFIPLSWSVLAVAGQRAIGGETVLADALRQEPPLQGVEH
jgi:hypothetical protein